MWAGAIVALAVYAKLAEWQVTNFVMGLIIFTQLFICWLLWAIISSNKDHNLVELENGKIALEPKSEIKYNYNNMGEFVGLSYKVYIDESFVETFHDHNGCLLSISHYRQINSSESLNKNFYPFLRKNQVSVDYILRQTDAQTSIEENVSNCRRLHESKREKYIKERFADKMKRKRKEGDHINPIYGYKRNFGRKID